MCPQCMTLADTFILQGMFKRYLSFAQRLITYNTIARLLGIANALGDSAMNRLVPMTVLLDKVIGRLIVALILNIE